MRKILIILSFLAISSPALACMPGQDGSVHACPGQAAGDCPNCKTLEAQKSKLFTALMESLNNNTILNVVAPGHVVKGHIGALALLRNGPPKCEEVKSEITDKMYRCFSLVRDTDQIITARYEAYFTVPSHGDVQFAFLTDLNLVFDIEE